MRGWSWEVAKGVTEVHELLCASDAHNARPGVPAPYRNPETTRRHVLAGNVLVLRHEGELVGMFTLTSTPPHGLLVQVFPKAARPAYLQRLAVRPGWLSRDALVGVRCVRRACEVARQQGAEVLRAEANPDLTDMRRLLGIFGFQQFGCTLEKGGRRMVFLQRDL